MLGRVGGKVTPAVTCDAACLCPCPKFSATATVEGGKPIAEDSWCVAAIEHRKTHAIEPDEAVHGRKPEITVWGLTHVPNHVLRQTVVSGPGVDVVLSNGSRQRTEEEEAKPRCREAI